VAAEGGDIVNTDGLEAVAKGGGHGGERKQAVAELRERQKYRASIEEA
jgi:hypothetical protein